MMKRNLTICGVLLCLLLAGCGEPEDHEETLIFMWASPPKEGQLFTTSSKYVITINPTFDILRIALAKAFPGEKTRLYLSGTTDKKGNQDRLYCSAEIGDWSGQRINLVAHSADELLALIKKYSEKN